MPTANVRPCAPDSKNITMNHEILKLSKFIYKFLGCGRCGFGELKVPEIRFLECLAQPWKSRLTARYVREAAA